MISRLLAQVLFEPCAFKASVGLGDDSSNAEPLVPVPWSERKKLGTPCGVLTNDLRLRPTATLEALTRLCASGVSKCVQDVDSSCVALPATSQSPACICMPVFLMISRTHACTRRYVALLLFLVRTFVAVEASALAVLTDAHRESGPESAAYKALCDEAMPHLADLRRAFCEPAIALIEHWVVLVHQREKSNALRFVLLHCHLVLLHGNLFRTCCSPAVRAELLTRLADKGQPPEDRPNVLRMAPSMSAVVVWAEKALSEESKREDKWMDRLLGTSGLLSSVFATMQEARPEVLAATAAAGGGDDDARMVPIWFERAVAVARREQSGGETFPPRGAGKLNEPEG